MRKVNRNSVATPDRLKNVSRAEFDYVKDTNKIKKGIYSDVTIKSALTSIYLNKCFLCEKDVAIKYDIEHFLPWSNHFPERAYDWNNLHQSCKKCNDLKRRKHYKLLDDDGRVLDIKLLDPCSNVYNVETLITYDRKCRAVPSDLDEKVTLMAEFLNDDEHLQLRLSHWSEIMDTIFFNWLNECSYIKRNLMNFNVRMIDFNDEAEVKCAEFCFRLYDRYLSENSEYSRLNRNIVNLKLQLPLPLIRKYYEQYCNYSEQPMKI